MSFGASVVASGGFQPYISLQQLKGKITKPPMAWFGFDMYMDIGNGSCNVFFVLVFAAIFDVFENCF